MTACGTRWLKRRVLHGPGDSLRRPQLFSVPLDACQSAMYPQQSLALPLNQSKQSSMLLKTQQLRQKRQYGTQFQRSLDPQSLRQHILLLDWVYSLLAHFNYPTVYSVLQNVCVLPCQRKSSLPTAWVGGLLIESIPTQLEHAPTSSIFPALILGRHCPC